MTNEGQNQVGAFYFNIDWEKHERIPADMAYFYAEYRQAVPNAGWTADWNLNRDPKVNDKLNPSGEGNYVFFEAEGRGQAIRVPIVISGEKGIRNFSDAASQSQ